MSASKAACASLPGWTSSAPPLADSSVQEPAELLRGFVRQAQLLACLRWLASFQILALVPLTGSVAYSDLADLTGHSVQQMRRMLRLPLHAGFLQEPSPGSLAHTPLSAAFVVRPSYLDALVFITETLIPTAMTMQETTGCHTSLDLRTDGTESSSVNSVPGWRLPHKRNNKARRHLNAFRRLASRDQPATIQQVLSHLDWESLRDATVVEVNAESTATAAWLASRNADLRYVLQVSDDNKLMNLDAIKRRFPLTHQFVLHTRNAGAPQHETTAAVYLLHLPDPLKCSSSTAHAALCKAELLSHLNVLCVNEKATLILLADILPELENVALDETSSLQDLLLMQMGHEDELNYARLMDIIEGAQTSNARLVVANKMSSMHQSKVALTLSARQLSA